MKSISVNDNCVYTKVKQLLFAHRALSFVKRINILKLLNIVQSDTILGIYKLFQGAFFIIELLKNVQQICKSQAVICFEEKTHLKKNIMVIIAVIIIVIVIVITIVISQLNLKR